jgi:hypothetical protein
MKLKFNFYTISLTLNNASISLGGGSYLGTLNWKTKNRMEVLWKNMFDFSKNKNKQEPFLMTDSCSCWEPNLILVHVRTESRFSTWFLFMLRTKPDSCSCWEPNLILVHVRTEGWFSTRFLFMLRTELDSRSCENRRSVLNLIFTCNYVNQFSLWELGWEPCWEPSENLRTVQH